MRTRLCDLLAVEAPVVQAPIGTASCPELAAAVSEAGGLGTIAITWHDPAAVERLVTETRALTARPFALNVVLDFPPDEHLEAALAARAPVVSLTWGDPSPYVERLHAGGALVVANVGSAEEARRAEAAGVDAVVAQGLEAGGHVWGTVSTLGLVPAVRDAVTVPVIAAGGISDGRGLAAVLALGADGAWIGTRFLIADEAPVHPLYRERLLAAAETDTVYGTLYDVGWPGAPHRTLRNSTVEAWEAAGRPPSGERPGEGATVARRADGSPVVRYSSALPLEGYSGEVEALSLWAGQGVGILRETKPAGAIVRELVEDAERILEALR